MPEHRWVSERSIVAGEATSPIYMVCTVCGHRQQPDEPRDGRCAGRRSEEPTHVEVGHKDGRVILNFFGTSSIAPSYIAWTPDQAREVAAHLVRVADSVERGEVGDA